MVVNECTRYGNLLFLIVLYMYKIAVAKECFHLFISHRNRRFSFKHTSPLSFCIQKEVWKVCFYLIFIGLGVITCIVIVIAKYICQSFHANHYRRLTTYCSETFVSLCMSLKLPQNIISL